MGGASTPGIAERPTELRTQVPRHKSEPPGRPELPKPLAKRAKARDTVQTRGLVHMLKLSSPGHVPCERLEVTSPTCPQQLPCCLLPLPMTDMGATLSQQAAVRERCRPQPLPGVTHGTEVCEDRHPASRYEAGKTCSLHSQGIWAPTHTFVLKALRCFWETISA